MHDDHSKDGQSSLGVVIFAILCVVVSLLFATKNFIDVIKIMEQSKLSIFSLGYWDSIATICGAVTSVFYVILAIIIIVSRITLGEYIIGMGHLDFRIQDESVHSAIVGEFWLNALGTIWLLFSITVGYAGISMLQLPNPAPAAVLLIISGIAIIFAPRESPFALLRAVTSAIHGLRRQGHYYPHAQPAPHSGHHHQDRGGSNALSILFVLALALALGIGVLILRDQCESGTGVLCSFLGKKSAGTTGSFSPLPQAKAINNW